MRYTKTINPLTIDQIVRYAPSALATEPMNGVSDKYSFVSTMDAIELIQSAGWVPYFARESKVRKEEKDGYQRHVVKFTMGQTLSEVGDERIDLLLYNSHDRGSAFRLAMGIFRLVCSNGLVVGDTRLSFAHKHIGFDQEAFLESVDSIAGNGLQIAEKVEDFKLIEMTPNETNVYARAASELISNEPEEIDLCSLTRPRRFDDRKNDLWTVYNRVQENVMRGGIWRYGRTESGKMKKRTRKVTSIDRDIKLNKALWVLTEEMSALKSGKALAQ